MADKDNYWSYAQIGLELAAGVLLGLWGGYWLDKKLGSIPWFTLGGAVSGLAVGSYLVALELFPKGAGKR
ncbi:MAG: AtpZ/AtpI family protein [Elusimicrobiota bacterium]|nr:AtpZ/AtpI family protein [Elusimicrobiota bacterium]